MLKTNDSIKRSGKICDRANFQQLWGSNSAAQAFLQVCIVITKNGLQIVCIPITSECCSSTRARIRPPANARAVVVRTLCKTSRVQSLKTGFTHIHASKRSKVGFQSLWSQNSAPEWSCDKLSTKLCRAFVHGCEVARVLVSQESGASEATTSLQTVIGRALMRSYINLPCQKPMLSTTTPFSVLLALRSTLQRNFLKVHHYCQVVTLWRLAQWSLWSGLAALPLKITARNDEKISTWLTAGSFGVAALSRPQLRTIPSLAVSRHWDPWRPKPADWSKKTEIMASLQSQSLQSLALCLKFSLYVDMPTHAWSAHGRYGTWPVLCSVSLPPVAQGGPGSGCKWPLFQRNPPFAKTEKLGHTIFKDNPIFVQNKVYKSVFWLTASVKFNPFFSFFDLIYHSAPNNETTSNNLKPPFPRLPGLHQQAVVCKGHRGLRRDRAELPPGVAGPKLSVAWRQGATVQGHGRRAHDDFAHLKKAVFEKNKKWWAFSVVIKDWPEKTLSKRLFESGL